MIYTFFCCFYLINYFMKINNVFLLDFIMFFVLYINYLLIMLILLIIGYLYFFFFFKDIFFSLDKKNIFFIFYKWKLFYYNKWFLIHRWKFLNYFNNPQKSYDYSLLESNSYDPFLKVKKLYTINIFGSMRDFNIMSQDAAILNGSKVFAEGELKHIKNITEIFSNYHLSYQNRLFYNEQNTSRKALSNLTDVEKLRLIISYKDFQTEELIKKLFLICDTLGPVAQQIKSKLLLGQELDTNNRKLGIKVDEQHLLDKVRNIIVVGDASKEQPLLVNELIRVEYKVNELQNTILNSYKKNNHNSSDILGLDQALSFKAIQEKILVLEKESTIKNLSLTQKVLNTKSENLTLSENIDKKDPKPKLSLRQLINERKKKKKIISPIIKENNITKSDDSSQTQYTNFSILVKNYRFNISFYFILNSSFRLSKRKNILILRFLKRSKRKIKKKYIKPTFLSKSQYYINDLKYVQLYSNFLRFNEQTKNLLSSNFDSIFMISLFQRERISLRYPRKFFDNIFSFVLNQFLKWFWGNESNTPKNIEFQRKIFKFKQCLLQAYPRNRSILLRMPLKDKVPLKRIILVNSRKLK